MPIYIEDCVVMNDVNISGINFIDYVGAQQIKTKKKKMVAIFNLH